MYLLVVFYNFIVDKLQVKLIRHPTIYSTQFENYLLKNRQDIY